MKITTIKDCATPNWKFFVFFAGCAASSSGGRAAFQYFFQRNHRSFEDNIATGALSRYSLTCATLDPRVTILFHLVEPDWTVS